jgi:hypothetical protein
VKAKLFHWTREKTKKVAARKVVCRLGALFPGETSRRSVALGRKQSLPGLVFVRAVTGVGACTLSSMTIN